MNFENRKFWYLLHLNLSLYNVEIWSFYISGPLEEPQPNASLFSALPLQSCSNQEKVQIK